MPWTPSWRDVGRGLRVGGSWSKDVEWYQGAGLFANVRIVDDMIWISTECESTEKNYSF